MSSRRWKHVDLKKPPAGGSPPPDAAPSPGAATPTSSPELSTARALFTLGELERAAAVLLPLAAQQSPLPGAGRLLGLTLGRMGAYQSAARWLTDAAIENPGDPLLQASLLSARLLSGEFPDAHPSPADGPLAEMNGALEWLHGQRLLGDLRHSEAAAAFHRSGALLTATAPAPIAAERASAVFIGEAVCRLAAGQFEAAQQCFSRLSRRERLSPETLQFARQLYDVAEALHDLDAAERAEAVQPLVDLVRAARLRHRFFDQEAPVNLWWDHLP